MEAMELDSGRGVSSIEMSGVCAMLMIGGDFTSASALWGIESDWLTDAGLEQRELAQLRSRLRNMELDFDFEEYILMLDLRLVRLHEEFFQRFPQYRRKKPQVCTYFLNGRCQEDRLKCEYSHVVDSARMPVCRFHVQGACRVGAACPFSHPKKIDSYT